MVFHCPGTTEQRKTPSEISNVYGSEKKSPYPFSLASLELLTKYGRGAKRLNSEKLGEPSCNTKCDRTGGLALSTQEVMKVARERFVQNFSQRSDDLSSHSICCALCGYSYEDTKHVELVQYLLASAEKVSNQQFDCASELLSMCDHLSSITGNPVQRIVYHFAEALRERICRETGRTASTELECDNGHPFNIRESMMCPTPSMIAALQELPFGQAAQFAGIQAMVDNVVKEKKVHVIDLEIRTGVRWTALMQALVARYECPLELLKITAVGTNMSKLRIQETGKRLIRFAKDMNLPFSFKIAMVSDVKDFKKDLFELEADEAVIVYSEVFLRTLLAQPDRLESLMGVIRDIQPCVLVITEFEANHNSPALKDRFTEALCTYSAIFDSLEACMDRINPNRMAIETVYLNYVIRNIIATEGEERTIRHEKIDYWRAYFSRFGMVETELSMSSMYQANLVVNNFSCGSSCTLDMNGKCLIVGWKGTPIISLSAWKFNQEEQDSCSEMISPQRRRCT